MVTYNNWKKQLKENVNYKSKDDLYNLTESLFTEFFKAYDTDDLDKMKEIYSAIDELKDNLKGKYDNVDLVTTQIELQKHKEYYVLKEYQHALESGKDRIQLYYLIIHELTNKLRYLKQILVYYFLKTNVYNNENLSELDMLIADIRDDIVDLVSVGKLCFKDTTPDDVNLSIETSKEIIHDVFSVDYLEYLKENGMVEIQMQMINIQKLNHQCNRDFKKLRLEIDDLFSKNNGFRDISESFIEMVKSETDVGASADAIMEVLPEYDIVTATFIPHEIPVGAEN